MSVSFYLRSFFVIIFLSIPLIQAQEKMEEKMGEHKTTHVMHVPTDLTWVDGPASLPHGAKVAMLEGDMSKPAPFTVRAKIPANYKIPPHFHPGVEHVTVLSGSCYMGVGDILDESMATKLPVGGFSALEIGTHHYFFTKEECEIQIHGVGPWGITYINPKDDPRNKAAAQ
jgi:quercetin dioxygenase-like cupin family protein